MQDPGSKAKVGGSSEGQSSTPCHSKIRLMHHITGNGDTTNFNCSYYHNITNVRMYLYHRMYESIKTRLYNTYYDVATGQENITQDGELP